MKSPQQQQQVRTMQAIVICLLIAVVYTRVFISPSKEPHANPATTPVAGQLAATTVPQAILPTNPASSTSTTTGPQVVAVDKNHPNHAELGKAGLIGFETNLVRVNFSKLGGRIINLKLNDYKLHLGKEDALDMVDNPDGFTTPLAVNIGNLSDDRIVYSLSSISQTIVEKAPGQYQLNPGQQGFLEFSGTLPDGTGIKKRISFTDTSYLFNVDIELSKPSADGQPVWLEWSHYFPKGEESPRMQITHLMVLDGFDKRQHVALDQIPEGVRDYGTTRWVSIGDLYFMATLLPSAKDGRNTILGREGEVLLARVAGSASGGNFTVYVGPKDYRSLSNVGFGLERTIDLGWFTFLAYPLLWMIHYLNQILGNYGLAIIALTLIVKTLMLPLTKASLESMKKLQDVQPEMKALRERVKDPNQLNQEIFALYKRKGVNPMGGCFPILIQIPVFLGLYQALLNSIELRHAPYALWINDLSSPEKLYLFGIPVPVMVLLMAGSMILQQWTTPPPSDPAQAQAMKIMPVVFAIMFIIFPMPAGLVLYWLVNNLISITQQFYLRREGSNSAYQATFVASIVIFSVGYLLTLI